MRKFFKLLTALVLFVFTVPAGAQSQARVDLYSPDASAFPKIVSLLDVYDPNGVFASGLKPEAVTVYEDGVAIPVSQLTEMPVPLQIVVAINPGPALDVRDSQGLSKYQRLVQVLSGWSQTHQDSTDDLSLVSLSGSVISHAPMKDFMSSLNAFQPDFRSSTPNLQSLAIALDTASAPTKQSGMKRAILFITQHMDDATIATEIEPYIKKAQENRIRVFVWYVDLDSFFVTNSAAAFNALALQTGGSFFAYSGQESFPDLESYFMYMRRVYAFEYISKLNQGGDHSIRIDAALGSVTASSGDSKFSVDIQPPNPIFVEPPLQITRQAPADDPFNTSVLLPEIQKLDVIIDFPDGHPRDIVRLALYVDGAIVAELKEPPFDALPWDLRQYTKSGEHSIAVETTDSLGLTKSSINIPVTVTVIQPPTGMRALLAKYRQPFIISVISMAALALISILFLSGRVKLPTLRQRREQRRVMADPLTQPITAVEAEQAIVKEKKRKAWNAPAISGNPAVKEVADAPAYLYRIQADGKLASSSPIPLAETELTFGTDPTQATHVLDDPSLSSLHARIKRGEDNSYSLFDVNSIAGTWVNYDPITRDGRKLAHGDVVHFGQLSYRFQLKVHPQIPEPKIIIETTEQ